VIILLVSQKQSEVQDAGDDEEGQKDGRHGHIRERSWGVAQALNLWREWTAALYTRHKTLEGVGMMLLSGARSFDVQKCCRSPSEWETTW